MADNTTAIRLDDLNDQLATTDSIVTKLANNVNALSKSFGDFSKRTDVQTMVSTINSAFDSLSRKAGEATDKMDERVRSAFDRITRVVDITAKKMNGIKIDIPLDFIRGDATEKQQKFNESILRMAVEYEKATNKLKELQGQMLALQASQAGNFGDKNALYKKEAEITAQMVAQQAIMEKNAAAYEIVKRLAVETGQKVSEAMAQERQAGQDLINLYKNLAVVETNLSKANTSLTTKQMRGVATKEDLDLVTSYENELAKLNSKIDEIANKYPKLNKEIKESFESSTIERNIKNREREASAIGKVTDEINKKKEAENWERSVQGLQLIWNALENEKKATAELSNLYKTLYQDRANLNAVNLSVATKQAKNEPVTQNELDLLDIYKKKVEETEKQINALKNRYPALAAEIEKAFKPQLLEQEIKSREKEADTIKKVTDEMNRLSEEKLRSTFRGAMDFSQNVQSINEAREAIKNLTSARDNLKTSDSAYQDKLRQLNEEIKKHKQFIDMATGSARRLRSSHFSLLQSANQLASAFGVMFSTYGIANFLKTLTRVTGEFEVQQTALKSIIKDGKRAEQMFHEIQGMAVASPYSVQQLVSYNKQLAAYRIETEKLLPTLKKLGDVASGVGVDMQRIILAYGQVKAANYLRGQELRQFSEAGINILGELAEKFSKAEGKIVTTADVFDRVSKRLVKFEDVNEVFDNLTKKGGIFYDMQAKQAKTVRGQITNLKDAFQIALYEIGQDSNYAINNVLKALRGIVSNLKAIVEIGGRVISFLVVYKSIVSAIAAYAAITKKEMVAGIAASEKIASKMSAGTLFNPVSAGISVAIMAIVTLITKLSELKKKQEEIRESALETSRDIIESYNDMVSTLVKTNDFTKSDGKLSVANTNEMEKNVETVKEFIKELNRQGIEISPNIDFDFTDENKREKAEEMADFINGVDELAQKLVDQQEKGKKSVIGFKNWAEGNKYFINEAERSYDALFSKLKEHRTAYETELVSLGKRHNVDVQNALESLKKLSEGQFSDLSKVKPLIKDVQDAYEKISKASKQRNEREEEFIGLFNKQTYMLQNYKNEYKNLWSGFLKDNDLKIGDVLSTLSDEGNKDAAWDLVRKFMQYSKSAVEATGKDFAASEWNTFLKYLEEAYNLDPWVIKPIIKTTEEDTSDPLQFKKWQMDFNAFVDTLNKNPKKWSVEKITDYMTTVEKLGKSLEDRSKEVEAAMQRYKDASGQFKADAPEGTIKDLTDEFNALEKAMQWLGWKKKTKKTGVKDLSSEYEQLVKFIRQLNSEYETLRKTFSDEESWKRVVKSFEGEFKSLSSDFKTIFNNDIKNIEFIDPEGLKQSLEKLRPLIDTKKFKPWTQKLTTYLEKNIGEVTAKVEVEFKQKSDEEMNREIEKLFSDYQISLELTQLGISPQAAKDIFNLDAADLAQLTKKINEYRKAVSGTDEEKKYEEFQRKLTEIFEKEQMRRLKVYAKYLQEEMSERVKIEMETLQKLAELEASPAFYGKDEQRERIKEQILDERDSKISSQIWKEFQQTEMYVNLFEDLGEASNAMLRSMYDNLSHLKGSLKGLSAQELKAIQNQIGLLERQMRDRNPFDAIIKSLQDFHRLRKDFFENTEVADVLGIKDGEKHGKSIGRIIKELTNELNGYYKKGKDGRKEYVEGLIQQEKELEKLYQAAKKRDYAKDILSQYGIDVKNISQSDLADRFNEHLEDRDRIIKDMNESSGVAKENLKEQLNEVNIVIDAMSQLIQAYSILGESGEDSAEELGKSWNDIKKKAKSYQNTLDKALNMQGKLTDSQIGTIKALQKVNEAIDKVQNAYETWMDNLDYLGGATSEVTEAQKELGSAIMESMKQVNNLVQHTIELIPSLVSGFSSAGIAINSAMGIIGLIAEAIQLVITLISAIGQFEDAKISAGITRLSRKVDMLSDSYNRLSEAFDSAFNMEKLRNYNALMTRELQEQIDYLNEELDLAESKKKKDYDEIKRLMDEISSTEEEILKKTERFYEELGGFGSESNYKNAAQTFVDSWYEAFVETGNGLQGLENSFQDFFKNMIKKQLMQKLADRYFADMLKEFDELLNRGDIWETEYFWQDYMERLPERLAEANDALTEWFSRLGGIFGSNGNITGLNTLQQGIQGITETSAEVIASYLEAIRLYIAEDNERIANIANVLGTGVSNDSVMSNIRLVANNTTAMNAILQSVFFNGAHQGTGTAGGIKVFMN